uniref:Uncharacterized protein n=1 Tax=Pristionchus pacificus TaxID=54126 RepID=A0A2A6C820_PRIPA|eukprot:PDM74193.1 hypothetical protein PRIPAC_41549 [Pristionchus pacificus]
MAGAYDAVQENSPYTGFLHLIMEKCGYVVRGVVTENLLERAIGYEWVQLLDVVATGAPEDHRASSGQL